jgi:hypothetical protein
MYPHEQAAGAVLANVIIGIRKNAFQSESKKETLLSSVRIGNRDSVSISTIWLPPSPGD